MNEIELKAHVYDRAALTQKLNSFATYEGAVTRDDTYYALASNKTAPKIRIRRETRITTLEKSSATHHDAVEASRISSKKDTTTDTTIETTYLVTYKRKELRTDEATGTAIEVNDEKECEVSSPDALIAFLTDSGYVVDLQKHKEVQDWTLPLPESLLPEADKQLSATFEVCTVLPLGDFLEIEVLSPVATEDVVARIHTELENLLEKVGISKSCIEKRYYSELLKAIK